MITATCTMRINIPPLDFTKVMSDAADKIIIPDIRFGFNRSVGIDNKPFPALEQSTIDAKRGIRKSVKKAGAKLADVGLAGDKTLVDTGTLRESFYYKVIKTNHVRIFIDSVREKIAYYLQIDGVGKKKKTFHFFGISQRAELQCIPMMKKELNKILGKSNGKR